MLIFLKYVFKIQSDLLKVDKMILKFIPKTKQNKKIPLKSLQKSKDFVKL